VAFGDAGARSVISAIDIVGVILLFDLLGVCIAVCIAGRWCRVGAHAATVGGSLGRFLTMLVLPLLAGAGVILEIECRVKNGVLQR
jgi:hypothetical protein